MRIQNHISMFSGFLVMLFSMPSHAAVDGHTVVYPAGEQQMQGFVAIPREAKAQLPGVLIIHDWMGEGPFVQEKAKKLAAMGYVAFAADIYGKGVRPKDQDEAGKLATKYKSDRALLRERVRAAFNAFKAIPEVAKNNIVVMGYCFGGTTALELARSGAPVVGTVSFHGGLSTPTPEDAKNIKGPVLAMHGADDPFVKPDEVKAFKEEMKNAHVKLTFIPYPGAVHSFTNPAAGNDNSKGAAYNANADKKSWAEFQKFLKKVFGA